MDTISNWVSSAVTTVLSWFSSLWDTVKGWLLDVVYAVFDKLLTWASDLIKAIPVPSSWASGSSAWSHLSAQALHFASMLHLPLVFLIIVGGWGVRFLINLIPSWITRA